MKTLEEIKKTLKKHRVYLKEKFRAKEINIFVLTPETCGFKLLMLYLDLKDFSKLFIYLIFKFWADFTYFTDD